MLRGVGELGMGKDACSLDFSVQEQAKAEVSGTILWS